MVTEILVKEPLTKEMIDAGRRLMSRLVVVGLPVRLALWLFTEERGKWRLMISSPLRATGGPDEVYRKIYAAESTLSSEDQEILSESVGQFLIKDELVESLNEEFHLPGDAKPVRFRGGIRGLFVEDALIYRSEA